MDALTLITTTTKRRSLSWRLLEVKGNSIVFTSLLRSFEVSIFGVVDISDWKDITRKGQGIIGQITWGKSGMFYIQSRHPGDYSKYGHCVLISGSHRTDYIRVRMFYSQAFVVEIAGVYGISVITVYII